jgi:uncharacterized protein YeaO (DUF488 family)
MVRTKSIKDPKGASDGLRVYVARGNCRIKGGSKNYDIREINLAPSRELLNDCKAGMLTEAQYTKRYLKEMKSEDSQAAIQRLKHRAQTGTITLLCWEKEDGSFCHRHILKKLIQE